MWAGGILRLSLSFFIIVFLALWFVSRRFSSSPALFAIVSINEFGLFTPIAPALKANICQNPLNNWH